MLWPLSTTGNFLVYGRYMLKAGISFNGFSHNLVLGNHLYLKFFNVLYIFYTTCVARSLIFLKCLIGYGTP